MKWPCSECPKTFTRKGDLTRHGLLHTGYRPHVCSECHKSFAQHSGLKTHMNVHTRDKPFRCDLFPCQAAFGDPSSCARHKKETHRFTGAYHCPDPRCKSSIKRRSAFTAHLRKHGMKYTGIDIATFYNAVAHGPRLTTNHIVLPKTEDVAEFTILDGMTYESYQPVYNSHMPNGTLGYPNDYSNDMDLHAATRELFVFSSRSSSLSPPSLTSSSSCPSTSPSPSPLDLQDAHPQFSLPYVNIAVANAPYDPGMPDVYPGVLSPFSQLMHYSLHDDSQYNKQPMGWST
ncbi:hypothetical protein DFH09DRAFT_1177257 [Mycena vulgaris]|nr:hypothetical protein DFH09DRAFT_1177257 [Mycena vulgaris]